MINELSAFCHAVTFGNNSGCQVRIAVGQSTVEKSKYHAQAQALINEKWEFLQNSCPAVEVGHKESFIPMAFFNVDEFHKLHLNLLYKRSEPHLNRNIYLKTCNI